jgi:hypothetical protein
MKISYSAVVLDEKSHTKLTLLLEKHYPEEAKSWKSYCHHMTITMGELPQNLKKDIDSEQTLTVHSIGKSDKAIAAGVSGYTTKNSIPHITLAVNVNNGGKPVMSNQISEWNKLDTPITITGTVQELKQ